MHDIFNLSSLMMRDQRLKDIVPFVVSVESGSFTAAAERLYLTSSAVSKSVARLEGWDRACWSGPRGR